MSKPNPQVWEWPAPRKCPRCGNRGVLQVALARWLCHGCGKRWSVKRRLAANVEVSYER